MTGLAGGVADLGLSAGLVDLTEGLTIATGLVSRLTGLSGIAVTGSEAVVRSIEGGDSEMCFLSVDDSLFAAGDAD